ncbi:MAG: TRAP transporter small permease [Roseitalea sp.]|jgi:TRAP-type C4-dicarboxylate transport system permease small subunit|nr:TRAP transporter small permease [Roseitalea sp.]MBO6720664.1 TRAP transporter small permease [Roseitalea sp.]MBO6743811.1 TRAP transporter small permease [Roseitalea sp.]
MSVLQRTLAIVRSTTDRTVVLIFFFMVLSVVGEIVGRTFNITVSNAVETASFAQIWLTAIGASVALRHGSMFALDTLTRHLDLSMARVLSVFIAVCSLILVTILFYGGLILTESGFRQLSPVQRMPMWIVFISMPIGMGLLALEIVLRVFERWHDPFEGLPEDDA